MAISYEQIKKANEAVKTTNISGKDYAEVNQRIKAFRMVYPEGFIMTDLFNLQDGVAMFKATVGYYADNGNAVTLGTGTAYERENSSFINKTSYIENCETSAVGRALGMAGFGIDTSVCSAEELQNAKLNQDDSKQPKKEIKQNTAKEVKADPVKEQPKAKAVEVVPDNKDSCVLALEGLGADISKVLTAYKFKSIDEMPLEKLQEAYRRKKASQKGAN